ncbi:MAG: lipocalin-like domain-containing protein [Sphingomicrobium sp.]
MLRALRGEIRMVNRRNLIGVGLILPMAASSAFAKRRDPSNPMIGTWSLIDATTVFKDGNTTPLNGKAGPYSGIIMYQNNGMMAVQIAYPRKEIAHEADFEKMPADQRLPYLDTYYAYFGRYEFDRAASIVHHFVQSSLDPSEIGIHYLRSVALKGDVVTLTTIPNEADPKSHNVLSWRRL